MVERNRRHRKNKKMNGRRETDGGVSEETVEGDTHDTYKHVESHQSLQSTVPCVNEVYEVDMSSEVTGRRMITQGSETEIESVERTGQFDECRSRDVCKGVDDWTSVGS